MIKRFLNLFRRNPVIIITSHFECDEDVKNILKSMSVLKGDYHVFLFDDPRSETKIQMFSTYKIEHIQIEILKQTVKDLTIPNTRQTAYL